MGVDKSKKGASYQKFFEQASGKKASELRDFAIERSMAFAKLWFAKKAIEGRGFWDSTGWTKKSILDNTMAEFETTHAKHAAKGKAAEQIGAIVDNLMKTLSHKLK